MPEPQPRYVVGVDPGKITGLAILDRRQTKEFYACDELPAMQAIAVVHDLILKAEREQRQIRVICEDYRIGSGTVRQTRQTDALKVIGALEYLCWNSGAAFFPKPQAPGDRNLASKDMLQKLGWWFPSKDGHQNDAAKHLLVGMLSARLKDAEDLL